MSLRVISWNVNSVRLRLRALRRLVKRYDPQVFCLQETKVDNASFPQEFFRRMGFEHMIVHGFIAAMTRWFRRKRSPENRYILVGDLNVAPLENDVWDHKKLRRVVTHTSVEIEALDKMLRSHDWVDAVRRFVLGDKKLFSWWSYRAENWKAADKGRRLDHIWVTPALGDSLQAAEVIKRARGWEPASDHAPVVVTLDLASQSRPA